MAHVVKYRSRALHVLTCCALPACLCLFSAELNDRLAPPLDHPAIAYRTGPLNDPVHALQQRLSRNQTQLRWEGRQGYLRSVLENLGVPVSSQIAVFSKTSMQAVRISPDNPRAIYFNDTVSVAWMPGGFIELASHDPVRGVVFYILPQQRVEQPTFDRREECLGCHVADPSLGVPGMMIRSVFPAPDGGLRLIHGAFVVDHRTPMPERWGGYYVTGVLGGLRHLGNAMVADEDHPERMVNSATLRQPSLERVFDTANYFSPFSDAAALLVFDHQMHMMNLITRIGWEARAAEYDGRHGLSVGLPGLLDAAARELVDYMLFLDEAPFSATIESGEERGSGFAHAFAARGPRDRKGRSLRDLDLTQRLLRYRCSYMIYSPAFDALPASATDAIYKRMWQVLSGSGTSESGVRIPAAERQAIVEILRDTKPDLPAYFQPGR